MSFQTLLSGFADSFVVDRFFADPMEIRQQIFSKKPFYRDEAANYAGYTGTLSDALRSQLHREVERVIGHRIKPSTDPDQDLYVRLARRGDEKLAKSFIHCDPLRFTAIIYLTPPENVPDGINYGTRIYERKKDGLNTNHYSKIKQSLRGKWTSKEFEEVVKECRANSFDLLYWKLVHDIPYKFNRLSIFEGYRFHSACSTYYGESNESGRLTLNFFFELNSK
jgi:Family of unknown function (DUF6445)